MKGRVELYCSERSMPSCSVLIPVLNSGLHGQKPASNLPMFSRSAYRNSAFLFRCCSLTWASAQKRYCFLCSCNERLFRLKQQVELWPDLVLTFSSEGFHNLMTESVTYPHMSCVVSSQVEPCCLERAAEFRPVNKLLPEYGLYRFICSLFNGVFQ
jgi:hypothetical protein